MPNRGPLSEVEQLRDANYVDVVVAFSSRANLDKEVRYAITRL
jgi:hypothetical protein